MIIEEPSSELRVLHVLRYTKCLKKHCIHCTRGKGHQPTWYAYWKENGHLVHQPCAYRVWDVLEAVRRRNQAQS